MINSKEINTTRLHLLGQDPVSELKFHSDLPMTDACWSRADNDFFIKAECCRTIGSNPKNDMETLQSKSPSVSASLLSLNFILVESNFCEHQWDNPENPKIGSNNIEPTYNIALQIIDTLSKENKLWVGALPKVRSSEVWRTYKPLPKEEENGRGLAKDLTPKLVAPKEIKLILRGNPKNIKPIPDFQAELFVYEDIGLEVFGREYLLENTPFICPIVGEDEVYGVQTCEGPILIANRSYLEILENDSKKAQEIYKKAKETLFFYSSQSYDQNEYDLDHFERDFPNCIHLLTNPGLVIKNKLKNFEKLISQSIVNLLKSTLPNLAEEISEDCESTKGLKLKDFRWNPKNGLNLECLLTIGGQEKRIKIEEGKTQVYSSTQNDTNPKTPKGSRKQRK